MKTFSDNEVKLQLGKDLNHWKYEDNALKRDFKFKSFVEAFSFMTAVALEVEKMDHHPDWFNSYNKLSISLSTHSEKGITQLDFDLARKIDAMVKKYE